MRLVGIRDLGCTTSSVHLLDVGERHHLVCGVGERPIEHARRVVQRRENSLKRR